MFFHHHKLIFLPILLILIGILALLTNLGVITATVWKWWPILFVLLGVYIFIWQRRKKRLLKSLVFFGAIHKLMKNASVEKLLENEKVQAELKKLGGIVEGAITGQIDKMHKKYTKKKGKKSKKIEK